MKGQSTHQEQLHLFQTSLNNLLDPKHPLVILAQKIPWDELDKAFDKYYSHTGRPSMTVRLMVSLLILKQMYNLSDESVVERWLENPYYQFFSGETIFQWKLPGHPTDLVNFRKRVGEEGVKKILEVSISLHGAKAREPEVVVDSTVQEKNITFPTDTKLYRKIIDHCLAIVEKENLPLRQSYRYTVKELMLDQRFRRHPKNFKKANKAQRRLKTIAGRLVRELKRNLSAEDMTRYQKQLDIFEQVLSQKRDSKNKVYSLHEPHIYCMSKGKDYKKYEFGTKASLVLTKTTGIIVGALSHPHNIYDGHTLPEVLQQTEDLIGKRPKLAICDRGYRGKSLVNGTQIVIPKPPKKTDSEYVKQKARKRFRRRAGIEPVIGHLKSDYGLLKNYLKGFIGDTINLLLAAAAFNFKKFMRDLWSFLLFFFFFKYPLFRQS